MLPPRTDGSSLWVVDGWKATVLHLYIYSAKWELVGFEVISPLPNVGDLIVIMS